VLFRAINLKLFVLVLAGLTIALPVTADNFEGIVPPPKAKASEINGCVAPVEDMRKNHMEKMLHQRDKTLREGVRTKQHSIAECVNCHITPKKDGSYANFGENEHFCSSCHNYAAVSIDCFECHRDKPEKLDYKHSQIKNTNPHHNDIAFSEKNTQTTETLDTIKSGDSK